MNSQAVLDFWFGAAGDAEAGTARTLWFTKSEDTDQLIREKFGTTVDAALHGDGAPGGDSPREVLASILLLDQFPRNIYRDTARSFAGDAKALRLAYELVDRGEDLRLQLIERWFAYMPFEHSEALNDQEESVRLFRQLAEDGLADPLPWAIKHLDVIKRFGRFPHRNSLLGRESTAEEIEFLREPGSRF